MLEIDNGNVRAVTVVNRLLDTIETLRSERDDLETKLVAVSADNSRLRTVLQKLRRLNGTGFIDAASIDKEIDTALEFIPFDGLGLKIEKRRADAIKKGDRLTFSTELGTIVDTVKNALLYKTHIRIMFEAHSDGFTPLSLVKKPDELIDVLIE